MHTYSQQRLQINMSWFRSQPSSSSVYVVVGSGGKTQTILDPEVASPTGAVEVFDPKVPQFDFQYKIPISKYSTLASVACKRKPPGSNSNNIRPNNQYLIQHNQNCSQRRPPARVEYIDLTKAKNYQHHQQSTSCSGGSNDRFVLEPKLRRRSEEHREDEIVDDFYSAKPKPSSPPVSESNSNLELKTAAKSHLNADSSLVCEHESSVGNNGINTREDHIKHPSEEQDCGEVDNKSCKSSMQSSNHMCSSNALINDEKSAITDESFQVPPKLMMIKPFSRISSEGGTTSENQSDSCCSETESLLRLSAKKADKSTNSKHSGEMIPSGNMARMCDDGNELDSCAAVQRTSWEYTRGSSNGQPHIARNPGGIYNQTFDSVLMNRNDRDDDVINRVMQKGGGEGLREFFTESDDGEDCNSENGSIRSSMKSGGMLVTEKKERGSLSQYMKVVEAYGTLRKTGKHRCVALI